MKPNTYAPVTSAEELTTVFAYFSSVSVGYLTDRYLERDAYWRDRFTRELCQRGDREIMLKIAAEVRARGLTQEHASLMATLNDRYFTHQLWMAG